MYSFEKVSAEEAFKLIDHAVNEAAKMNRHIAIAVCGAGGELI